MANQNIKIAKFAGFCYGVKRAVDTVKKLKNDNPQKEVFILGELIHNAFVIKELEELGIKTINSISELPKNATVIIEQWLNKEIGTKEACDMLGISKTTFYRLLRRQGK